MTRRRILISLLLAAACTKEQPRYNVLLVTLDTTRADRIGKATPAIDSIARTGVRFTNADSPVPLTLPAHATLLSGLLPLHHGVRNNGAGVFPSDRPTLATVLSENGYRTGAFVASFVLDHRFGLGRGFDAYDDAVDRDPEGDSDGEAERRAGPVIDAALGWLARADSRPYFAWVHLYDPHAPYLNGYDGEIAYMDAQLARLFQKIDRTNTVIVIVGDHGESLGEHGEMQHGLLLYESTLHVPLIISAPSLKAAVVNNPVSTVDVAQTIAGLTGTSIAANDGRDLFAETGPRNIYAETQYPMTFGWSELSSLRSGGNKKLISGEIHELFDLDLGEKANVLQNERRTFRDLATRLEAIRATAVKSQPSVIDEETKAKLASLGYVAPTAPAEGSRRDPRLMIGLFRQWEQASEALSKNRPEEAARICERLVREDPRNRVFRSTLAKALARVGNNRRAIDLYREAVALSPNDADAWYDLAAALQETGNADEALKVVEEALRRDPNRADGHNMRGVALAGGDPAAAVEEFRKAIALDPRNARAYSNLGNAFRATARNQEAGDAYRRAIDLAPRYVDPLNGLGVLLVQEGRGKEAIPLFDTALAIQPAFYEARLNRAIALDVSGDRAAAIRELTRLLADLPDKEQSVRTSATHLLRQLRP